MKQNYTQFERLESKATTSSSLRKQLSRLTRWLCSLIIICGLWTVDADAQVSAYTFAQSSGTYAAVSGTTVFATGWDESVSSVSIPFTFNYNGTGYTSCNVSTNGFITFGATAPASNLYSPIAGSTAYAGAIAVFGYDLISTTAPSIIVQTTTGTAPNRTFVVQWTNAKRYDFGALSGDVLNFQIRLNEAGGVALNQTVVIIYGTNSTTQTINTDKGQVGLRGASNADFNDRSGANNTAWNATAVGTTNADVVNFKSTVVPASGLTFTWTPVLVTIPSCNTLLTPANAATGVSTEPTVLTYNSSAGAASYDVYFGTTSNPPLLGNTTATSVNITGTLSGTTYFWYTAPRNSAGAASGCVSNQRSFTTLAGPANDECAGAVTLTVNATALAGTTVSADMSLAPLTCSGSTSTFAYDTWYKFTAINTSQTITVTASTLDPVVQAFSGTCGALISLSCVDVGSAGGTETLALSGLTICNTYYIRVYGYGTTGTPTGTFTIKVAGTSTLTALTSATSNAATVCNDGVAGNITLTATGGAGGTITWYAGGCGTGGSIGTGSPLVIAKPTTATTYFARRETSCGNDVTACVSTAVAVNQISANPGSATASAITICNGGSTTLTLNSGGGGTGEVIKWYSTSCGIGLVGTGNNLSVSPTTTTTYFGRYEDGAPCNYNSLCASVTITVNQKSVNPTSATASATTICNGDATTLTLNSGGGGTGEVIKWYSTSCGVGLVGTGNNLSVSPTTTTTYFGRYEDGAPCNFNTLCASVTITVNQKSANPTSATASATTICNGNATTLTLNGGGGGTGEVIKWYSTSCGVGLAGTGNNLSVSPTTTTTYFGRYEDGAPCNYNSLCASITITVSPNYTITASAGSNGVISPNGVTTLCSGANQAYTITANSCYRVSDVLVDGVSVGAVGTYTFTNVTANHTISATFALNAYTITVTAGANGSISPASGSINCGDNASYTITPGACYSIADVVVDGVSQGAIGTYTFTNVTANHTISATFVLNTYTIAVTAGANGSISPASGSVNCGDNATYTITPGACYSIADVVVDGISQGAVGTYTFTNVTANHTISATFVLNTYTISVTAGANGSISPATGSVNCADNATYTITADACYSIADVVVDGVSQGALGTYTFTNVTANHTISATFVLNTYTITVTAGANGSISPATGSVNCGDNATYTITPDACYSIADVVVDGVSQGAVGTYTFTNITANHTISATFVINTYTITVTAGANGSINPATGSVNCGDNATYTITADACFAIADVMVDGISQGAISTYTFTNVTATHTISASFITTTPVSVTITADPGNTICPGTAVTFTANPTNGGSGPVYQWYIDGNPVAGATGSSFTSNSLADGSSITVTLSSNAACAPGTPVASNNIIMTLYPAPATPGTISGPTDACPLIGMVTPTTYSVNTVPGAVSYTWTVPAGVTIVSGQGSNSIDVTFDNSFALTNSMFTLYATSSFGCNSGVSSLEVEKLIPGIPTAISGPVNACPFMGLPATATYSIDAVPHATSYTWIVSAGASIVSGQGSTSIEVSYLGSFTSGTVKVTANSNCGSRAPRSLTITKIIPVAPVVINGPTDACPYIATGTPVTYSIDAVLNATSYTWTVPANVSLLSGQGTTSITVTFNSGYSTAAIKVRSVANCGASGDRPLTVGALSASIPGVISGPSNACAFIGTASEAVYTIHPVTNASSYTWSAPAGATITSHPGAAGVNDTIITVTYNSSFVSGTAISVQAKACNTSSARSLVINRTLTAVPGLVSGSTNACPYMASASNPSGIPVTYTIRKVINATSYAWTAPSGASISAHPAGSGVNDTIIQVSYSASFVSGSISVASANACGSSAARTLAISKLGVASPGGIDVIQLVACPDRQYSYTVGAMPSNAVSLFWTVPASGIIVSGQGTTSVTVSYGSGSIAGNVTVSASNNCSTSSARSITIKIPACPSGFDRQQNNSKPASNNTKPLPITMELLVSPNPTVSDFKLQVLTAVKEKINVRILDIQGRELKHFIITAYQTTNVGSDLKAGTYMVEVRQGNNVKITKLIKF